MMNHLFSIPIATTWASLWLFVVRVTASAAMLVHGWPKLQMLIEGRSAQFSDPIGVGTMPSLLLAVFAEVLCSILLIIGVASRVVAMPLAITMAIAFFIVHGDHPLAKKELAGAYLLIYGTLIAFGPGRFSLDAIIGRNN